MVLASTQVWRIPSKNVSSPHRISLRTHWKVEQRIPSDPSGEAEFLAFRVFHCPTGISRLQHVCFCFEPFEVRQAFFLNGIEIPWNIIDGLATVPITSMMEPKNRVELRWRGTPQETPYLPEHFKAWLEISNDSQIDL